MDAVFSPFMLVFLALGTSLMVLGLWLSKSFKLKEVIEAILISNRRLAAIEAAGDGIGIVNARGNLVYMNQSLLRLHGIAPEKYNDYIGKSWTRLYSDKGKRDIHDKVMPVLQATGYWQGEAPVRGRNGKVVYAEMSLTLLPDGGFVGTARDVTDKILAQRENLNLQKQVFQAQKMESVGRLAGGIAHDFNNIIGAILGYAEFLETDLDRSSPSYQFAHKINRAAQQARNLVDQILAFSRRQETLRKKFEIVRTIQETVSLLEATMAVPLKVRGVSEQWYIEGNENQISQILINLCLNGADAAAGKEISLEVELKPVTGRQVMREAGLNHMTVTSELPEINYAPEISAFAKDGRNHLCLGQLATHQHYLAISVSDNGCGMDLSVLERIFEPFYTTKDKDHGTGLGLSTTVGILAAHQGAAYVQTVPGRGATFTVFLPLAEKQMLEAPPFVTKAALEAIAAQATKGTKILLVEDRQDMRCVLKEMLERMGCEVAVCENGPKAIDTLREKPNYFDLVLSDYIMPKMTGVALAREISYDFPDIPIILLSGYSEALIGEEDVMAVPAIKKIVKKPIDHQTLEDVVMSVVVEKQKLQASLH